VEERGGDEWGGRERGVNGRVQDGGDWGKGGGGIRASGWRVQERTEEKRKKRAL